MRPMLAIFVGGKSRRMGTDKGLLRVPGRPESILEHLVALGDSMSFETVLVGDATPYRRLALDVPQVEDDPPGGGPLAGLRGASKHAMGAGCSHLITLACDMPFVTTEALRELWLHPGDATVVAPRRSPASPWEPMLARYHASRLARVLDEPAVRRIRSFQSLFREIDVAPLPLSPVIESALRDWDTPEDVGP